MGGVYIQTQSNTIHIHSLPSNIVVIKRPKFSLMEQMKMLFVPAKMMWLTLLTWIIWFGSFLNYYGIVLLSTELLLLEAEGGHCRDMYYKPPLGNATLPKAISSNSTSCVQLKADQYADVLFDAVAELPGAFVTYFLLEKFGRKITMASEMFALVGVFFVLWFCLHRFPQTVFLFVGRAVITGAMQALFLFTSEVRCVRD